MNTPSPSADTAAAVLRIRAGQPARKRATGDLKGMWHRVLGSPARPNALSDPGALQVEVSTQAGRRLYVLQEPEGTVDLALSPGTYDILVVQAGRRRRYTVPLTPGASFDLDLFEALPGETLRDAGGR